MIKYSIYNSLIERLLDGFGSRLKTVVLFGSRARKQAKEDSDHDIFLVIKNLSKRPLDGKNRSEQQFGMSLSE